MIRKMEQVLLEEGELFTAASGSSMLPCIRPQKDILHLILPEHEIGNREVILYRRENGRYILHRIVGKDARGYILCGDNQWVREYGIRQDQVLGVLRGFYRGETYIDCEANLLYRSYVKIWCASLGVRKWILQAGRIGWRGWKKLRWKKGKSQ